MYYNVLFFNTQEYPISMKRTNTTTYRIKKSIWEILDKKIQGEYLDNRNVTQMLIECMSIGFTLQARYLKLLQQEPGTRKVNQLEKMINEGSGVPEKDTTVLTSVRLPPDFRNWINHKAETDNVSQSHVVNEYLELGIVVNTCQKILLEKIMNNEITTLALPKAHDFCMELTRMQSHKMWPRLENGEFTIGCSVPVSPKKNSDKLLMEILDK